MLVKYGTTATWPNITKYWLLLKFHVSGNHFQLLHCAKVDGCSVTLFVHLLCSTCLVKASELQSYFIRMQKNSALYGSCRCQVTQRMRGCTPSTKEQHPAGMCCWKRKQNGAPDSRAVPCLSCLVCWTQSCDPNLAVYKVWKVSQPESFHRAPSTSSRSYGKGAGELSFEQHWRKWVWVYGITPHLAEQNCYQMWPCSGVGISDKLKGGCAGCQMT